MKPEKIEQVAVKYHQLLSPNYEPIRFTEERFATAREYRPEERTLYLQHACFMSLKIQQFVRADKPARIEKADRWLGNLQRILSMTGLISMKEAALDNAPDGAIYDRDA
ncbi:MAG TPA: hypothetical protein PKD79_03130 [Candidatus Doudnabacteria bacterium]|nr:hypothetical protein [Candidatus Doudnabacteria bacterium]